MFAKSVIFWIGLVMALPTISVAQASPPPQQTQNRRQPGTSADFDASIKSAVQDVSAARLQADVEKLAAFRTRSTISSPEVSQGEIGAARAWIQAELERYSRECGGCLEVKLDRFVQEPAPRIPRPTEIINVYAVLRGSDPANAGRMYVISGHYDSRGEDVLDAGTPAPGANDDGSGTAAVLEAARVLSRNRFPATIVFVAVAGEEQGLNGSTHFAQFAQQQGWNIGAVLNNDMVGGDKSPGQNADVVRVFSEGIPVAASEAELRTIRNTGGENDSPARQLARQIRVVAHRYLPGKFAPQMVFRPDRFLRGGDQMSFSKLGFPAVRLTDFRENYDHQHQNPRTENGIEYGDLPKFVDYEYLANVTRLNVATLAWLAAAPAPPADVRLETKELVNTSTLLWQPSPGGLATGYEVLWRPTTGAEWDHVENVGNVTRATINQSKDNVVFAVRAVGGQGLSSMPVVPVAQR